MHQDLKKFVTADIDSEVIKNRFSWTEKKDETIQQILGGCQVLGDHKIH